MGDIPTAEEQEQKMADRAREQAQERVDRREKLGQQSVSEPTLEGGSHRAASPDLPSVGSQLVDAQNPETDAVAPVDPVDDDEESVDTSNTADGDAIPPSEEEVSQAGEPHDPAEEAAADDKVPEEEGA